VVRLETGSLVVFLSRKKLKCKISLSDKIFEIFAEGLTLESLVPPAVMEKAVIIRSRAGRIMLL